MSAGVVVSAPVAGSAVTTARTRPSVALEPDEAAVDASHAAAAHRRTPGHACGSCLGGARGHDPGQSLPGQTGWISAAPVATTISCGMDVEHPVRGPDHDHRPGVDRDDLVARVRVEDADRLAGPFRLGGRGQPGSTRRR